MYTHSPAYLLRDDHSAEVIDSPYDSRCFRFLPPLCIFINAFQKPVLIFFVSEEVLFMKACSFFVEQ